MHAIVHQRAHRQLRIRGRSAADTEIDGLFPDQRRDLTPDSISDNELNARMLGPKGDDRIGQPGRRQRGQAGNADDAVSLRCQFARAAHDCIQFMRT